MLNIKLRVYFIFIVVLKLRFYYIWLLYYLIFIMLLCLLINRFIMKTIFKNWDRKWITLTFTVSSMKCACKIPNLINCVIRWAIFHCLIACAWVAMTFVWSNLNRLTHVLQCQYKMQVLWKDTKRTSNYKTDSNFNG